MTEQTRTDSNGSTPTVPAAGNGIPSGGDRDGRATVSPTTQAAAAIAAAPADAAATPKREEGEGRVRWLTLAKYLVITIVVMFLLLILLDKVVMPWYVKLGKVETVPSVVGLTFPDAQRRLEKLGFEVKRGEPRFDDRYAAGTVVMQLPYGGQQTKQGRRVYLTLSRGTELIPMPDLTGLPLREARMTLMRNGFDMGEATYEHNDTIMKELIYGQTIPARVPTRPGAIVNVMISTGPSTRFTMMPNLISLDVDVARTRIENAGLVLGVVKYKDQAGYGKNTVIEQDVAPYAQVAQGAAVDLTIVGTPDPSEAAALGGEGGSPEPTVTNLPLAPKPNAAHPPLARPPLAHPPPPYPTAPKPNARPVPSKPRPTASKPNAKPTNAKPTSTKPAGAKPNSKPATAKPNTKPGAKPATKPAVKPKPKPTSPLGNR